MLVADPARDWPPVVTMSGSRSDVAHEGVDVTPGQQRAGAAWVVALRRRGENVPRAVALVVWLGGVLSLTSALLPEEHGRLHLLTDVVGDGVTSLATGTTVAVGIAMMLLSCGLRRRQRTAWAVGLALCVAATALHLLKGLDVEEATVTAALAVVLFLTRRQFGAAATGVRRRRVLPVVLSLLVLDLVLGLVLLLGNRDEVSGQPSFGELVQHVLLGLVGVPGPLTFLPASAGRPAAAILAGLGAITFLTALVMLLSRPIKRPARTSEQEAVLRRLLDAHGDADSLGWFATRDDRDLIVSPSGKAAVSYRVVGGVALAAGDPIGDPEAWPHALDAFLTAAANNAWAPAAMGCGERAGAAWAKAGLDVLELGDEAVVDAASFRVDGRTMRGVRQAVGRVARAGYAIKVRRARDISPVEWLEVRAAAEAWRAGEVERGFSMALGRLGDPRDCRAVLVTARDGAGRLRAVLHLVPWGSAGLSLDVMGRDREADNGVNEAMIATLLQSAPLIGVKRVSLNFAVFRSALERGADLGAGPVARAWRRVLLLGSRWWQIEQLYRFNAKFAPEWVPRYLCYPGPRELPRVAVAALRAEAFLVLPGEQRRPAGPEQDPGTAPARSVGAGRT